MTVSGIGSGNAFAYGHDKIRAPQPRGAQKTESAPETSRAEPAAAPQSSDEPRGGIRNLQEGHFRGVADVRLRINFHAELSEIEATRKVDVAAEQTTEMAQAIGDRIDAAAAALGDEQSSALAAAKAPFVEAVRAADDAYAESRDTESLTASLRAAFDSLTEALSAVIFEPDAELPDVDDAALEPVAPIDDATAISVGPDEEVGGASETVLEDGDPAEVFDTESFLADLEALFTSTLSDLTTALDAAQVLPELSEPSGHRNAYDKFLAIYQDLQSAPTAESPATVEASLSALRRNMEVGHVEVGHVEVGNSPPRQPPAPPGKQDAARPKSSRGAASSSEGASRPKRSRCGHA